MDKAKMHVPQSDFASLNFASVTLHDSGPTVGGYSYTGPQDSTSKAVIGSMISNEILALPAPRPNSTWLLEFNGPALSCKTLSMMEGLGANITRQLIQVGETNGICWGYLAWTPEADEILDTDNISGYLPFSNASNGAHTLRSATLGGSPLSLFLAVFPGISDLNPSVVALGSTIMQCTLYNASYTTNFSFVNGVQTVSVVNTSSFKESNAVSALRDLFAPVVLSPLLTLADVQTLAYQSIFDVFQSMLLGSVSTNLNNETPQTTFDTKLGQTALINSHEVAFLQSFTARDELPWNGSSIETSSDPTQRDAIDMLEEMFRNVTLSLASQDLLK